jgi:hypothetical protein
MLFDERMCGLGPEMDPQRQFGPVVGGQAGYPGVAAPTVGPCPTPCPPPCPPAPIMESPFERCVRRDICHDVPHVCPIHTRVINNHIFRHTYVPQFTCSEENLVTNVHLGSCCDFIR